ncbi:MAG: hypothetical protein P1U77_05560 [Rubripirellula sp.]|jgi:hypothetical protein|nr:hypothetical protein [Planctomycetaceae bacterium]MDF1840881.1 hypothetical protein [Rubripirellula sp.]
MLTSAFPTPRFTGSTLNKPFKQLTDHGQTGHDDSERDDHLRLVKRVRQRQIWTILFAIMLASIASFATAQ